MCILSRETLNEFERFSKIRADRVNSSSEQSMFAHLDVFVMPNGMGKNRVDLFRTALTKHGAKLLDSDGDVASCDMTNRTCVIIVDETAMPKWLNVQSALKTKFKDPSNKSKLVQMQVVKSAWLSESLKQKKCIDMDKYLMVDESVIVTKDASKKASTGVEAPIRWGEQMCKASTSSTIKKSETRKELVASESEQSELQKRKFNLHPESDHEPVHESKRPKLTSAPYRIAGALTACRNSDSSYEDSGEDDYDAMSISSVDSVLDRNVTKLRGVKNVSTWTCAKSSKEQGSNLNQLVTDKLTELSTIYENTRDKFRALGYQKAISAVKACKYKIESYEDAIALPGVGERLALKIWEIVETGDLAKLDEFNSREDIAAIKLFSGVHGVGPTTAQSFVTQGFRTLADLSEKANLNRQQKIGLKHYADFQQRIPREEAAEIERFVKKAALSLNSELIVQACGSYRRGKATCGDVDILVTHPDGHSHKAIFSKLIDLLHKQSE